MEIMQKLQLFSILVSQETNNFWIFVLYFNKYKIKNAKYFFFKYLFFPQLLYKACALATQ